MIVALSIVLLSTVLTCQQQCNRRTVVDDCNRSTDTGSEYVSHSDFDSFNNESGTDDGHYIVPNYVHFVKFGQREFSFVHVVCVLAALKNQKPEKLFIHTDVDQFQGKYWDVLMNTPGFKEALTVNRITLPTEIFGQTIRRTWQRYHGGDVTRIKILMEYGGIYLDSDSFIVRSLDDFRRYEMTIGWKSGKDMGNQILIAHRNARFLKLWYESYRDNYNPKSWYYNAGSYPTKHILEVRPYLVHRVEKLLGNYGIWRKLYNTAFAEWKDYYTLHLLNQHQHGLVNVSKVAVYPVVFNETNVLNYPVGFRAICKSVYPDLGTD